MQNFISMVMISHIQVATHFSGFLKFLSDYRLNVDQCRGITARVEKFNTTNYLAVYFDYGLTNSNWGDARVLLGTHNGVPVIKDFQLSNKLAKRDSGAEEFENIGEIVESVDSQYWQQQ